MTQHTDVVVVGGGRAGLSAGHRPPRGFAGRRVVAVGAAIAALPTD